MGQKASSLSNTALSGSKSIFDFEVAATEGKVALDKFKGKSAYLIVNVASKWGLTAQNYLELEQVYTKYSKDLEILAFPCNNFG